MGDSLQVFSSTFTKGTPVTIAFTLAPGGTVFPSSADEWARAKLSLLISDSNIPGDTINIVSYQGFGLTDSTSILTGTIAARVGDTLSLYADGQVGAIAGRVPYAIADFMDPMDFYAISVTPGVSIKSASGHDYSPVPSTGLTAVPEASTYGVVGLSVLLGAVALRKRRKSFRI